MIHRLGNGTAAARGAVVTAKVCAAMAIGFTLAATSAAPPAFAAATADSPVWPASAKSTYDRIWKFPKLFCRKIRRMQPCSMPWR